MKSSSQMQQGQAAVETAMAVLVLVPLFVGVAWLGRLQLSALNTAHTSRQIAFAAAQGQTLGDFHAPLHIEYSTDYWRVPTVGNGHAGAAALANDWLRTGHDILRLRARDTTPTPGVFKSEGTPGWHLVVSRSTSILTGAGGGLGDSATQNRIAESSAGWTLAGATSRTQASRLRGQLRGLDVPWRRGELSIDWLTPWDDLIPTERVVRTRSAGRR